MANNRASVSEAKKTIRLLVVDDHAIIRAGLVRLLAAEPDFEVVGEAVDGEQAVQQADQLRPDAIVMDVYIPNMHGIEATRRIKERHPDTVIIGFSIDDDQSIAIAMKEAGANAHVSKNDSAEGLIAAVRRVCFSPAE